MIERAARQLVTEIAAKGPADWTRAVVTRAQSQRVHSGSAHYTVSGEPRWRPGLHGDFVELVPAAIRSIVIVQSSSRAGGPLMRAEC